MNKDNDKIDLDKSFKKAFRNPSLIHRIQDKLFTLDAASLLMDSGILGAAIMSYRVNAMPALIKIMAAEDRGKVTALIGEETMKDIDEYMEGEEADPQDIPGELFTHQK